MALQTAILDYYLIAGESMPEVLGNYTYLTGTVPVPAEVDPGLS